MAFVNGGDAHTLDVAQKAPCPVTTVGMGGDCAMRIDSVEYHETGSAFSLGGERYEITMVGEFNVRNAAMAVCAALFAGLTAAEARAGLIIFAGSARTEEPKGDVHGLKVGSYTQPDLPTKCTRDASV